jgi:hypothetical protein
MRNGGEDFLTLNENLSFTGVNSVIQPSGFEWLLSTLYDASLLNFPRAAPRGSFFYGVYG